MSEEQLDRREQLMAAMDAAEEGTLEVPEEKEIEVVEDDIAAEAAEEVEVAQDEPEDYNCYDEQSKRQCVKHYSVRDHRHRLRRLHHLRHRR